MAGHPVRVSRLLKLGGLLLVAAVAGLLLPGCPSGVVGDAGSATTCLGCHNGRTAEDMRLFLFSAHKSLACDVCHIGAEAHVQSGGLGGALINPASGTFEAAHAVCATCHQKTVEQFAVSGHASNRLVNCFDCHDVHSPSTTIGPTTNNLLCRSCHVFDGFQTNAEIEDHTKHPVDPKDTGASRCTFCHMPPTERTDQEDGPHDHTFATIPPIDSAIAAQLGADPVPPNSCAGIAGCHDGTVPASPIFDVENEAQMTGLQAVYETWYLSAP